MKTKVSSILTLIMLITLPSYYSSAKESISTEKSKTNAEGTIFNITKGNKWVNGGNISVKQDEANQTISIDGHFSDSAGYVIQRNMPIGGRVITLHISGSSKCILSGDKLFKLEVNDVPVSPIERNRINIDDPNYVTPRDGKISFKMPRTVNKFQIVFWNATLKKLSIKGYIK